MHGDSTRTVDDLVKALGADTGISKSEVSRIRRTRTCPPTPPTARLGRRRRGRGRPQRDPGFDVGETESKPFWTTSLRSLKARELGGVQLAISGTHTRLIAPIETVFAGASPQRCRFHFMRNVITNVPRTAGPMVTSITRTIIAQPDAEHALGQLDEIAAMLTRSPPKIAAMRQIGPTNPLERVNKEIKRRIDVVGTFPNPAALLRLAGHVLIEQHDESDGADRRCFSEAPWPC